MRDCLFVLECHGVRTWGWLCPKIFSKIPCCVDVQKQKTKRPPKSKLFQLSLGHKFIDSTTHHLPLLRAPYSNLSMLCPFLVLWFILPLGVMIPLKIFFEPPFLYNFWVKILFVHFKLEEEVKEPSNQKIIEVFFVFVF